MAVVLVVALAVGSRADASSRSPDERARSLAESIKCPTCRSQSVATSDAPAAEYIRAEIDRRIAAGESDDVIRGYFAGRYGDDILLSPPSSGLAGMVWVLPVAALVIALAGLGWAFVRWRRWGAEA